MNARKLKATSAILGGALCALTLAGCSGSGSSTVAEDCVPKFEFPTIAEGKLTISTYDGLPYFGKSADGTPEGIDVGFLQQFAADACLEPDWVIAPSASVIQSVASGRADVAAGGWYSTAERAKVVDQSGPSYVELPTIFSKNPTANLDDLVGKKVGTISGYTWVSELKTVAGELKEYQSLDSTLQDLAAGRIDAAVLGSIDAPYLVAKNDAFTGIEPSLMEPDERVSSSVNPALPNYPHTKGNTALSDALNQALAEAKKSGRMAEILGEFGLDPELANTDKFKN